MVYTMPGPLSSLRRYNVNKKTILERNGWIIFGKYSWPKCVKTNYLVPGSGKDGTPKKYYTLECLLFLLKNVQLHHPVYVRQADAQNIPVVRRPYRKELLKYLNGETNTSANIDRRAPREIPTAVEHVYEYQNQQEIVKKPKLEEGDDQLAAWLDAPKESYVTTEHVRSLSDMIEEEKDVKPNVTDLQRILNC